MRDDENDGEAKPLTLEAADAAASAAAMEAHADAVLPSGQRKTGGRWHQLVQGPDGDLCVCYCRFPDECICGTL